MHPTEREMADKGALELIGAMLCAATLFVVTIGGFVVSSQMGQVDEVANSMRLAQLPAAGLIADVHGPVHATK
jgi:hypothetical protein